MLGLAIRVPTVNSRFESMGGLSSNEEPGKPLNLVTYATWHELRALFRAANLGQMVLHHPEGQD
jgi:hypothetical protein